jgi:hypothetical protein
MMNAFAIIVAVFPAVLVVGAILMPVLAGRRAPRFSNRPRPADVGAWDSGGSNQRTPIEAEDAGIDVDSPDELASVEGDQYLTDWTALQSRFVD